MAGARFERSGRVYFVDAGGFELQVDDLVLVDVEGTVRTGRVVVAPAQVLVCELVGLQGRILGKAG